MFLVNHISLIPWLEGYAIPIGSHLPGGSAARERRRGGRPGLCPGFILMIIQSNSLPSGTTEGVCLGDNGLSALEWPAADPGDDDLSKLGGRQLWPGAGENYPVYSNF